MPFIVPDEEPELPVGNHNVRVIAARTGLSRNGNEIIFLDLEELGAVEREGEGPGDPRTHTALLTLTPRAMFRVRQAFDAFGVAMPAAGEEFDEFDLIGKTANVEIIDPEDGYPPKVDSWAPFVGSDIPDDLPPEPVPPEPVPPAGSKFGDDVPWDK
jgi:hypothetical protein